MILAVLFNILVTLLIINHLGDKNFVTLKVVVARDVTGTLVVLVIWSSIFISV